MLLSLTIIGHYLFAMYASSLCCVNGCTLNLLKNARNMHPDVQERWLILAPSFRTNLSSNPGDLAPYQFWFFVLSTPQACTSTRLSLYLCVPLLFELSNFVQHKNQTFVHILLQHRLLQCILAENTRCNLSSVSHT
jgi:hypothetical protein